MPVTNFALAFSLSLLFLHSHNSRSGITYDHRINSRLLFPLPATYGLVPFSSFFWSRARLQPCLPPSARVELFHGQSSPAVKAVTPLTATCTYQPALFPSSLASKKWWVHSLPKKRGYVLLYVGKTSIRSDRAASSPFGRTAVNFPHVCRGSVGRPAAGEHEEATPSTLAQTNLRNGKTTTRVGRRRSFWASRPLKQSIFLYTTI